MRKIPVLILLCWLVFETVAVISVTAAQFSSLDSFTKSDRVLILAPYPDDEVIGCAGVIQGALKAGSQVRIMYLTNGDHNQFAFIAYKKRIPLKPSTFVRMGETRRKEAIASAKSLGLSEKDLVFLGYPDFGTFAIFSEYWHTDKPYRSLLTHISKVPYKENLSFQAAYVGESILSDIKRVLFDYQPTKVFVSHPADTNVDHKSLYLFSQVALEDLKGQMTTPQVYPYLIHCVGWPKPRHYHPDLALHPPDKFLDSYMRWFVFDLDHESLEKKHKAVLMHKSQTIVSAFYLLAFVRKNELFTEYPELTLEKQGFLSGQAIRYSGYSDTYDDEAEDSSDEIENKNLILANVSFALVDNTLAIRIEKTRGFKRPFNLTAYLFGYSGQRPFAAMPKVRIIVRHSSIQVFDAKKRVTSASVSLTSDEKEEVLHVPLSLIGDPNFILTGLRVHGEKVEADAIGFRKIVIK